MVKVIKKSLFIILCLLCTSCSYLVDKLFETKIVIIDAGQWNGFSIGESQFNTYQFIKNNYSDYEFTIAQEIKETYPELTLDEPQHISQLINNFHWYSELKVLSQFEEGIYRCIHQFDFNKGYVVKSKNESNYRENSEKKIECRVKYDLVGLNHNQVYDHFYKLQNQDIVFDLHVRSKKYPEAFTDEEFQYIQREKAWKITKNRGLGLLSIRFYFVGNTLTTIKTIDANYGK